MPFTDAQIRQVRKMSRYHCIVCGEPFVDVHHITPEKDGGPSTLDNAAPLCGGCHTKYGNNPDFRKQIREKRDLWYEICAKRYENADYRFFVDTLEAMDGEVANLKQKDKKHDSAIESLKGSLLVISTRAGEKLRTATDLETVSATSGYVATAVAWVETSVAGAPDAGHLGKSGADFHIVPGSVESVDFKP